MRNLKPHRRGEVLSPRTFWYSRVKGSSKPVWLLFRQGPSWLDSGWITVCPDLCGNLTSGQPLWTGPECPPASYHADDRSRTSESPQFPAVGLGHIPSCVGDSVPQVWEAWESPWFSNLFRLMVEFCTRMFSFPPHPPPHIHI